jgi:putative Mg2+ transporter-C (MgtC) family protein
MELREVTILAVIIRITCAALFGGLLGLEREIKNRAAGLRTYMLVCVGACLVMLTNQYIFQSFQTGDPVRMGAQVVSGIGFLGAGTIVVTRHRQIKGLTTAAGLWAAAGVGLALGIGFYEAAVAGAVIIFVVITLLQRLDTVMHNHTKRMDVYFELSADTVLGDFLRSAKAQNMEIADLRREFVGEGPSPTRSYTATVKLKNRHTRQAILEMLCNLPGLSYAEEL